jgi:hypothetical protein
MHACTHTHCNVCGGACNPTYIQGLRHVHATQIHTAHTHAYTQSHTQTYRNPSHHEMLTSTKHTHKHLSHRHAPMHTCKTSSDTSRPTYRHTKGSFRWKKGDMRKKLVHSCIGDIQSRSPPRNAATPPAQMAVAHPMVGVAAAATPKEIDKGMFTRATDTPDAQFSFKAWQETMMRSLENYFHFHMLDGYICIDPSHDTQWRTACIVRAQKNKRKVLIMREQMSQDKYTHGEDLHVPCICL